MKDGINRPSSQDLEAYIDGRLERSRIAEIEELIAADSKLGEMVRAMRFQNEALRCLGADILDEPVPERLRAIVERRKADDSIGGPRGLLVPAGSRRFP